MNKYDKHQIIAYKSPYTNDIYTDSDRFKKHIDGYERKIQKEKIYNLKKDELYIKWEHWRNSVTSLEDFIQKLECILENLKNTNTVFGEGQNIFKKGENYKKSYLTNLESIIKHLKVTNYLLTHDISNSHTAPLGGDTNWGGRNENYRSYNSGLKLNFQYVPGHLKNLEGLELTNIAQELYAKDYKFVALEILYKGLLKEPYFQEDLDKLEYRKDLDEFATKYCNMTFSELQNLHCLGIIPSAASLDMNFNIKPLEYTYAPDIE